MIRVMLTNSLQNSALLKSALPEVRSLALSETIYASTNDEDALQIALQNLYTSPTISDETIRHVILEEISNVDAIPTDTRDLLAEFVLTGQWEDLVHETRGLVSSSNESIRTEEDKFASFLSMLVEIFACSRKIASIDAGSRMLLGTSIYNASSISELMELPLTSYELSTVLDGATREIIANDFLDKRYDLLLSPDRFDCDETPWQPSSTSTCTTSPNGTDEIEVCGLVAPGREGGRIQDGSLSQSGECPICLGASQADLSLPCAHVFCTDCIDNWIHHHGNPFPCPVCRTNVDL